VDGVLNLSCVQTLSWSNNRAAYCSDGPYISAKLPENFGKDTLKGQGQLSAVARVLHCFLYCNRGFVVRSPAGARDILVPEAPTPTLGPTQRLFQEAPGLKRPGREVDIFSPSRVEFKNTWSYTSIPPDFLRGVTLN
jgi:hypothetical protein